MNPTSSDNRQREAQLIQILGTFFSVLGGLVLVATFWCWGNYRAVVVNLGAGSILALIGVAMILGGRAKARDDGQSAKSGRDGADGNV